MEVSYDTTTLRTNQKPMVAVIGAGFSGLRCAAVLLQRGINVTIFEARHRIGGRVSQISTGGNLVDVGANWIHEPNGNPIMKIAEETKTTLFPRPAGLRTFGSDGQSRPLGYTIELHSVTRKILEEAAQYGQKHAEQIDPYSSIMDFFKDRVMRDFANQHEYIEDLINESERMGQWDGEPASLLSLKHHRIEDGPGGTDCFVASTYKAIAEYVAKPALEKGIIHFGAEITGVSRLRMHGNSQLSLETKDGREHSFDEVVVTCPLGWLKQHKDDFFHPPLTANLSKAIDNMSYGRLEKLYLTFPSAFWLPPQSKDGRAPSNNDYPCATHFHHPTYVDRPLAYPANQVTYSLAHLPGGVDQPTLLFYIHGPYGGQVCRSLRKLEPNSESYNDTIDKFAKPFYSRLPNYRPGDPRCKPVFYFCSMWQEDPLAGNGSYSYFRIGQVDAKRDIETMRNADGLSESEGIWLAGEHVAPYSRLGTTVGAYLSGENVAERICQKWRIELPFP